MEVNSPVEEFMKKCAHFQMNLYEECVMVPMIL